MPDARTHVVLEFAADGSIAIRGEGLFCVPANFNTLDEITDLFRFTKTEADAFVAMMTGARVSARFSARALSALDLADLRRQNAKVAAEARKRLENMPAPSRRLPRHLAEYGRKLAARHAAEQVFDDSHPVVVEKVRSRRPGNGNRIARRVPDGRSIG